MNSQPTIQLLYISNEKCHFIDREKKKCGTKLMFYQTNQQLLLLGKTTKELQKGYQRGLISSIIFKRKIRLIVYR